MTKSPSSAVIVAHPDDETLWCGGYMLRHPEYHWTVATLCRASDADRAPRFARVLHNLSARGRMGDLDDGPDQRPLLPDLVANEIQRLVPDDEYDLVFTHGPRGEYTRHRRHEECCRAVCDLWAEGRLRTAVLKMFAYEDGGRAYLPRVRADADERLTLTGAELTRKRRLMTETYGFAPDSWEGRAVPGEEGFRSFTTPETALRYLAAEEVPG